MNGWLKRKTEQTVTGLLRLNLLERNLPNHLASNIELGIPTLVDRVG